MLLNPLRDSQLAPPTGYCIYCSGELYGEEEVICPMCLATLEQDEEEYNKED